VILTSARELRKLARTARYALLGQAAKKEKKDQKFEQFTRVFGPGLDQVWTRFGPGVTFLPSSAMASDRKWGRGTKALRDLPAQWKTRPYCCDGIVVHTATQSTHQSTHQRMRCGLLQAIV
jgi:hypothetical protein